MVAVPIDLCLVDFQAAKCRDKLNAAGTKFLKTDRPKDTANAICIFRFYHPNSIYDIYRGTCASMDWVVGLCEIPESWQKGRMSAVFQSCVELLIDLEDDVLPFKLTMEFSRSKLLSA